MKKKFKNKLDNGAIAKLASITSSAITTFKEKKKQITGAIHYVK